MPATTPMARSKTAALARISDLVPKGYTRWTAGQVRANKTVAMARKFHERYAIGATPAQRLTRKGKGLANTVLVLYWPVNAEMVEWLLLATPGSGLESEHLREVSATPRLVWLGYELVRHATRGRTAWTWRRTKTEMKELHALLAEQLNRHNPVAVAETLQRIARQPGFHGIREQSRALFQEARRHGFGGELPTLFYVQKVSHGEALVLT
jgi:hypothetical protein